MKSLSYIELDVPFCTRTYGVAPCTASIPTTGSIKCFNSRNTCQDTTNFLASDVTWRFAKPASYLPADIDIIAASIVDISYTPATVSLGKNIGTRATLSITFKDHPHSDTGEGFDKYLADRTYDPYSQGTFWGKFRARQPFVRGQQLRWITGLVGDDLADMETRYFVVDSFDGPTPEGKFTIIAKDVLKFADGDRAQAPVLSNGFLSADITASATSATLLPSGIGDAEYPTSGYINIGGNEVASFTRSGNTLTLVRGQLGTTASTHKAQDRCQTVLRYVGQDVADIVSDLLQTYADVPASYITLADWQAETSAYLGTVYTANICEPTSVNTLLSELVEQAGLAIWDDNISQQVRLKVLHGILTNADTFTPENTLEKSLTTKEQPDQRLSRVQVYFGQKDPTKPLSNLDNYRSTSLTIDDDAEVSYGSSAIRTIYSRWIPEAGRSIADRLGAILIGRFRDPPRRLTFATARYADTDVELGQGYRVEAFCIQDATGAQSDIAIQTTRVNPGPDRFTVEAEEMLWTVPATDVGTRYVIFDANRNNVNVRTEHDSIYPPPQSGDAVIVRVYSGVIVGSSSNAIPAMDIGSWPAGVTVYLRIAGRIEGCGGNGGLGGYSPGGAGLAGAAGGTALYTRQAITLDATGGEIFGGGGGGGGGGAGAFNDVGGGGGGGGGGAGHNGGVGSVGGYGANGHGGHGLDGTDDAGGAYGIGAPGIDYYYNGGRGGTGGGPGLAGSAGLNGALGGAGGAGGAAGKAIDGLSYITVAVSGDFRGGQVN